MKERKTRTMAYTTLTVMTMQNVNYFDLFHATDMCQVRY